MKRTPNPDLYARLAVLASFALLIASCTITDATDGAPAENRDEQNYVDQAVHVRSSRTNVCYAIWDYTTPRSKIVAVDCTDEVLMAIAEDSL